MCLSCRKTCFWLIHVIAYLVFIKESASTASSSRTYLPWDNFTKIGFVPTNFVSMTHLGSELTLHLTFMKWASSYPLSCSYAFTHSRFTVSLARQSFTYYSSSTSLHPSELLLRLAVKSFWTNEENTYAALDVQTSINKAFKTLSSQVWELYQFGFLLQQGAILAWALLTRVQVSACCRAAAALTLTCNLQITIFV